MDPLKNSLLHMIQFNDSMKFSVIVSGDKNSLSSFSMLSLCLVFSRALQGFFFAHFPLFESHVKRLRLAVENACFMKTKSFTSQVIEVQYSCS